MYSYQDYVEDLLYWWHFIYATSLIMPVCMRFQLSWLDSSVCLIFPATMEILIHYISLDFMDIMVLCISSSWRFWSMYIVRGDDHICSIMPIHGHCTLMYPGLLDVFADYMQSRIMVLCWLGGWSSIWVPSSLPSWDGLIMYFGHRISPLISYIRGHLL